MPRIAPASDEAVAEAARRLGGGEVVAFPTETVYGLGADTFNERALARVFALKGRPAENPLIAHVAGEAGAQAVAGRWDSRCATLARNFWPGPLTLVLPRASRVPERATAGWPTIAVRAPAHPVARRLLAAFGGPVSAPSANRSGGVSPTTARHVADDFADRADLLILDGGRAPVGIESTVIDLTVEPPAVLRPGAVTLEALQTLLGDVAAPQIAAQAASPGTSLRHYQPTTPLELVEAKDLSARLAEMTEAAVVLCIRPEGVPAPHRGIAMPCVAEGYAAELYEALRAADRAGAARIVIEAPSATGGLWLAINDRLRRATG